LIGLAPALLLLPTMMAFTVLFACPLILLVWESVHRFSPTGAGGGFTAANYARLLTDPYSLRVLGETFKLATAVSVTCLVLGTPFAWCLRLAPRRVQGLLLLGLLAPLLISVVVRSFGWVVILGEFGLLNAMLRSLGAPGSGRTHFSPRRRCWRGWCTCSFRSWCWRCSGRCRSLTCNCCGRRNLGAKRFQAFLAVLPLSAPGMVAGVTTVFALTTGAYVTVAVLGGTGVRVLAVVADEQAISGMNWPFGAAIGVLLLVTTAGLLRAFQAVVARLSPVPA